MKRKIFSILFALVLICSFSLVTAAPAAAVEPGEPELVGSFSRTYQTTTTSTDFYLAIGLAPPVYVTIDTPVGPQSWWGPNPSIASASTYDLFHGMTDGAFLFEDIQFGSSSVGPFTISSVSDDPDFDDFAAFLTNGTDDNIFEAWIWPIDGSGAGGIRCADNDPEHPTEPFFFESHVFPGTDVGTDFPGWVVQSVSLTFDAIYTSSDWLTMDYTVEIYAAPPTEVWVAPTGVDSNPGTESEPLATIQKGIDMVAEGGTVNVAAGTYSEPQLSINENLTILGAGQDDVIIQRSGGESYFLSVSGAIDFTMKDLTIDASGSATTNFVAHISGLTSTTFENVTVIGQGKDYTTDEGDYYYEFPDDTNVVGGLDLINVTSASLTNVTVRDVSRNGFSFTNVNSITLKDFTASNCGHTDSTGWAGLALYRTVEGESKLILKQYGVNSISNSPIGVNAHIISGTVKLSGTTWEPGSLSISDDVLIPVVAPNTSNSNTFALEVIPSAPYKVYATNGPSQGFASYFFTTDDAIAAALVAKTEFGVEHVVYDLATPKFIVGAGMSIQSAIDAASDGDTIIVAAGIYEDTVDVGPVVNIMDKSLTLLGAQADVPIVEGYRAGDESILRGKGTGSTRPFSNSVVCIMHSDVVVNGFTIENGQSGIFMAGGVGGISNILVSYNYIKDTGTSGFHAGVGRNNAVAYVTIDHNYIASNLGRGILTNGGGTTITDNTFYGNGKGIDFQGGDPYSISFPDYAEPKYPTLISGNTFTDDSTSIKLRLDKCHQSITITGNDITEARNDAIKTRNTYDVDIVNPAIHYNNIWNNEFGINNQVAGINLDALYNWWGKIGGPGGEGLGNGDKVSTYVSYDPWLTEDFHKVITDGIRSYGSDAIELQVGWNTLSVPCGLKGSADTFDDIQAMGDYLISSGDDRNYLGGYWFDAHATQQWKGIDANTKLEPGKGFYIRMSNASRFPVLYFDGSLYLPSYPVWEGWNLVGSMFGIDKTTDAGSALGDEGDWGVASLNADDNGDLAGDSESHMDKDTALNSLKTAASVVVSPSVPGQLLSWAEVYGTGGKAMCVGEAYWVFMLADGTLAGFEVTPFYFTYTAPAP